MHKIINRVRQLFLLTKKGSFFGVSLAEYKVLLQNPNFVRLASADIISLIGSKISYFALIRKVYEITGGNVVDLGSATISTLLPYVFFGSAAGTLADRVSRRLVMITADIFSALFVLSLIFIDDLTFVKIVAFLLSSCYVFSNLAQKALEPNLVARHELPLLNSFKSCSCSFIIITGSALGGGVVGFAGTNVSFLLDAFTFIVSAVLVCGIRYEEQHLRKEREGNESWNSTGLLKLVICLKNDIHFSLLLIRKNEILRFLFILEMAFAFLFSLEGALFYPFVRECLRMGDNSDIAFGGLLTADSVGLMLGSIFLVKTLSANGNRINKVIDMTLYCSVIFFVFSLNKCYVLSVFLIFLSGFISAPIAVLIDTMTQEYIDDIHRAKVISFINMLNTPLSILSISIGTYMAKYLSVQGVFLIFALLRISLGCYVKMANSMRHLYQSSSVDECSVYDVAKSIE